MIKFSAAELERCPSWVGSTEDDRLSRLSSTERMKQIVVIKIDKTLKRANAIVRRNISAPDSAVNLPQPPWPGGVSQDVTESGNGCFSECGNCIWRSIGRLIEQIKQACKRTSDGQTRKRNP